MCGGPAVRYTPLIEHSYCVFAERRAKRQCLQSQLSCRTQNDSTSSHLQLRSPFASQESYRLLVFFQTLDDGDEKRSTLTAPRSRHCNNVMALRVRAGIRGKGEPYGKDFRDGFLLNWSWDGISFGNNGFQQHGVQGCLCETFCDSTARLVYRNWRSQIRPFSACRGPPPHAQCFASALHV